MNKYSIFVQARMSSSRSPGKVAEDIMGKPMLLRQLERLRNGNQEINIVCVTSTDNTDDVIEEICKKNQFNCFRGSLNNVLERYLAASDFYLTDYVIRIGGDDPLVDVNQVSILINKHEETEADFIYTSHRNGWPLGCVAELISVKALKDISNKTKDSLYLEHIIPWFHTNHTDYKCLAIESPSNLRRPEYYFTVDYPEDLELVKTVFKKLRGLGDFFDFDEVIKLCDDNPSILDVNRHLHSGFDV